MSTPTASVDVVTTLPPIKCAPWCEKGDGHTTDTHPSDQHCSAGNLEIDLHREAPEQVVPGGDFYRRDLSLTLWKDPFSEPYTELFIFGQGGIKLAMDELEQLGRHALHLVEMARGETGA